MQQPNLSIVRIMIRRTRRRTADLKRSGSNFLTRLPADMRQRARTMFQVTRRRTADLKKSGSNVLTRLRADIRQKEYVVFAEPVLKPIMLRFKAGSDDGEAAQAIKAPERDSTPAPPAYQDQAGEDAVDAGLVEEIFVRSTAPVAHPRYGHGPGGSDPSGQADAAESRPGPTGELEMSVSLADGGDIPEDGSDVPVKTPSIAAGSTAGTTQSRLSNEPLVRTMVEALPDGREGDGSLSDFLSGDLQDVFNTTDYTNPRTKALLKSREHVDVYELAQELKEYARRIGAVPPTFQDR